MKAIRLIVIDRCWKCPYHHTEENLPMRCWVMGDRYLDESKEEIPSWCPLRPLPERLGEGYEYYDGGYADGWNDCLGAIGGDDDN